MIDIRFDKTLLKIRMDNTGCLGSLHPFLKSPGLILLTADCKESPQPQSFIGRSDQTGESGLFQSRFLKEYGPLFRIIQSGDIRFQLTAEHDSLGALFSAMT